MNEKNTKQLLQKYPKIFAQHTKPMTETCMCWLFECGDGWYNILDMLCSLLQWDIEKNGYPEIEAVQVKEKYGTLRFYTTGVYKEEKRSTFKARMKERIYNWLSYLMQKFCKERDRDNRNWGVQEGMIRFAEYLSAYVCERCGSNSNVTQTSGWIVSLCDKCMKEHERKNGVSAAETTSPA